MFDIIQGLCQLLQRQPKILKPKSLKRCVCTPPCKGLRCAEGSVRGQRPQNPVSSTLTRVEEVGNGEVGALAANVVASFQQARILRHHRDSLGAPVHRYHLGGNMP